MKSNNEIVHVPDFTHAYLVKTCNGKYYSTYINENRIDYYKDPIRTHERLDAKDQITDDRDRFLQMKAGDLIVMGGYRHQKVMLGILLDTKPIYGVHWIREVDTFRMPWIYPFLYRGQTVVDLKGVIPRLIRHFYYQYRYHDRYHLVVEVNQSSPIRLQSLYGLERIIFEAIDDQHLTIKVHLESPGIIEFISEHQSIIQMIFKLIILLIQFKKNKQLQKEHERLFQFYQQYQIEALNLSIDKKLKKNPKKH